MGTKSSRQTVETRPWGQQIPYLSELFQGARQLKGKQLPGENPLERQGAEQLGQYAQSILPQYVTRARRGNEFLLSPDILSPDSNPYLQQYMDATTQQIMQGLTEYALPSITGNAFAVGNVGSSRQGIAEALATQRALQQVGAATSGLASSAYGQGLQAMLGAQQLSPAIAALGALPAELTSQAGQQLRALDTLPYANELQKLRDYQSLVSGQYGATQTGPAMERGGLLGGIGGAAMGAGTLAALTQSGLISAGAAAGPVGWGIIGLGALAGML